MRVTVEGLNNRNFEVWPMFFLLNVISALEGTLIDINLTLKAPIMTAADDIHKYFFIVFQRL